MREVDRDPPIKLLGRWKKPDILLKAEVCGEPWTCIVEVKVNAEEGPQQLQDYRAWLRDHTGTQALLVTLTRDHHVWSENPDTALVWRDLLEPVKDVSDAANGPFERSFWDHLKLYLEVIMPTFEGFSIPPVNFFRLLKEIDLFLGTLLRTMGFNSGSGYWHKDRAAYWIREARVTAGFWWWVGSWDHPQYQNVFAVWRDGEPELLRMATLEEIMAASRAARERGALAEYLEELTRQVRAAFEGHQAGLAQSR